MDTEPGLSKKMPHLINAKSTEELFLIVSKIQQPGLKSIQLISVTIMAMHLVETPH